MTKNEFLENLHFPAEWISLDLYPDELFALQLADYEPDHVESSEHTRNGAFTWWLHQAPSAEILEKLARASSADPDTHLKADVQARIRASRCCNDRIEKALTTPGT
jgi:hypothetical protein